MSHDVVKCDVDRDVSTAYCQSSSGDEVDWSCVIKYDALLRLVVFFFSKRNVAIYITRDYIVRQKKNLAFIVIHHDEKPQLFLAGFSFKLVLKKFLLLSK